MLQNWGETTSNRVSQQFRQKLPTAHKDAKKVCWYTTFGMITVLEQNYRLPDQRKEFRSFVFATGIYNPSYSLPLERRTADFGADSSFCRVNNKLKDQKARLKENKAIKVCQELYPFIDETSIPDQDAPVRRAHRYLQNRMHQLDYKAAIENDLPIGSGEIESAHRYVIQKRLKIAGAWWLEDNASKMLSLRVNRANNDWDA